jgi:hypothetical protein
LPDAGFKAVLVIFGRTFFHFEGAAETISIPSPISAPADGRARI